MVPPRLRRVPTRVSTPATLSLVLSSPTSVTVASTSPMAALRSTSRTALWCALAIAQSSAVVPTGSMYAVALSDVRKPVRAHLFSQVYNFTGTLPHGPTQPPPPGGGGPANPNVSPVLSGLPEPWSYNGCWVYVRPHMWRDIAHAIIVIILLAVFSPSRWTITRTSPSSRVLLAVPLRITPSLALSFLVRSRSRAAPFSWSDKCLPGSSSMLLQRCPHQRWCHGHKRCGLQHGMRRQFYVRFSHDVRYFRS